MVREEARLEISENGAELVVRAGGQWVVATAGDLDLHLRNLEEDATAPRILLDLAGLEALDTAGAWLILRTQQELTAAGHAVELQGLAGNFEPLLRQVSEGAAHHLPEHPAHHFGFIDFLARIGRISENLARRGGDLVAFFGLVCIVFLRSARQPGRLRWTAVIAHIEQTGVDSLPIVGLLSFLIGIVFAFQGADQLRRFGAEIYTVNLLGVSILRELGALLTAIIIAGRSGSAFTAQIGTMKVNEEIDAMQVLGLDPLEILVLPRLIAMLISLPLVAFFSNIMALLGGALMAWSTLGITIPTFLHQLLYAIPGWTFWLGLLKAPFFAAIISLTGCYEGLRVTRSAESVGRQTTRSVVESIFLIIIADALFSILFSYLRI